MSLPSTTNKLVAVFALLISCCLCAHKGCGPGCSCKSHAASTNSQTNSPTPRLRSSGSSLGQNFDMQQKKERKKTKEPRKKKKRFGQLGYEELKKEKDRQIARGDHYLAIKYIEQMIPLCTDLGELSSIMLELADLLFKSELFVKAERLYKEFLSMYPGDPKAEYASYQAIVCCHKQTSDFFRDQTKTKEAIELAHEFIARKEVFTTHLEDVVKILQTCQEKMMQSEMNVFNFYIKQGNFLAAQTRLDNIGKEYIPILPHNEPLILQAACTLAEKQNDLVLLAEKKSDLQERFPEFVTEGATVVAQGDTKEKTNFVNKF